MNLRERISAFASLGNFLQNIPAEEQDRYIRLAQSRNGWSTPANIRFSINVWANLLQEQGLKEWVKAYEIPDEQPHPKQVGLVMAGNIPLQGFHDLLCVLISGHRLSVKLSASDPLPQLLTQRLLEIEPRFASFVAFREQLKGMDAYIASGSESTIRNFEYYLRNKAHILRKNRNSCAVLSGNETTEDLKFLGRDMLQYWGLSSRNVGKLFVPRDYYFPPLFEAIEPWSDLQNYHKWVNNYDYYKSILLVNGDPHLDTGFLLFKEQEALASPVSVIYYQHYKDAAELEQLIEQHSGMLEIIVGSKDVPSTTGFGQAHRPGLGEYTDGVDTLYFLLNL